MLMKTSAIVARRACGSRVKRYDFVARQERGETIGDTIGYSIRLETRGGLHSSVMFCTNGVLLRMLTQGETLQVCIAASHVLLSADTSHCVGASNVRAHAFCVRVSLHDVQSLHLVSFFAASGKADIAAAGAVASNLRIMESSGRCLPECWQDMTHIVVDEIHERDRFADFLLILLRDALPAHPHLRLARV